MADRENTTERIAEERSAKGEAERTSAAGADPVVVSEERPVEQDLLDAEAPASMPEAEQPVAHEGPAGDGVVDGGIDPVGTPAYDTVPDLEGTDPTAIDPRLEEILNAEDTSGGLDGRNDSQLSGGQPTDPNAEAPMGGLEGAAGKLTPKQQGMVDTYRDLAFKAAADGNEADATKYADAANQYLIEEGVKQAPPAADKGAGTEVISNFGSGAEGKKQVWDPEKGEVVEVDSSEEAEGVPYGTEAEQLKQTGTAASGDGGEGTTAPPKQGGLNEDRTEDSDGLPGHLRDPSAGWGDEHEAKQWESATGGDVDPTPEDDGTIHAGDITAGDPEDYTAEYEEGYVEPDLADAPPPDPNLDHEFMEGGA